MPPTLLARADEVGPGGKLVQCWLPDTTKLWIIYKLPTCRPTKERVVERSGVMLERPISRVIHGVTLRGSYSVQDGIVTVKGEFGSTSSRVLRGSKPGSLAYVMLRELYYETLSLPERDG